MAPVLLEDKPELSGFTPLLFNSASCGCVISSVSFSFSWSSVISNRGRLLLQASVSSIAALFVSVVELFSIRVSSQGLSWKLNYAVR